ncbi:hypothetical protein EYF80_016153 [Liparis tanakae]|uniref:Uncharacterized protein n=1 Tax=Liparis tanakae TaxID=230148 RepID=A0A4Z2I6J2_9TELE|nr:hypothetical protein EYF80_016153 [Liparis tanakae]
MVFKPRMDQPAVTGGMTYERGLKRHLRTYLRNFAMDERCGGKRLKLQVLPSAGSRGKLSTRGLVQVLLRLFLWTLHKRRRPSEI